MYDRTPVSPLRGPSCHFVFAVLVLVTAAFSAGADTICAAQTFEKELATGDKPEITIRDPNGRVRVVASDEQRRRVSVTAESPGAPVTEADVHATVAGGAVQIEVRARGSLERERIDLTVRVPERSRVRVQSEAGAVDVVGNLALADVSTNTGTIHADVPLDAVSFNFLWESSRPRFLSDVELPKIKEKAGGVFQIAGRLGNKKPKKDALLDLHFVTRRGLMLLNVDPNRVPSDLRERALTEAAKAIVRSGNAELVDAVRTVSPRLFGEYTRGLPALRGDAPSLVTVSRVASPVALGASAGLVRVNVVVTDVHGRAIPGLEAKDFTVYENGQSRAVRSVEPSNAPFNLVLLLDVSGSVEERIDFIRKAARNFLNTASPQDRIAIVSFRDDIQVISDFTTDRALLSQRLEDIEAGGATAYYDALAYVLVETLKPLRNQRTAVVIMSDGDDNRSFVPFASLLDVTAESGTLIYPLYVPSVLVPEGSLPPSTSTLDPLRTRFLSLTTRAEEEGKKLAEASGGVFYPIRHLEDLQRAYDDVVAQLRTAYTLTYESGGNGEAGDRRLHVRVDREGAAVRIGPSAGVAVGSR